MVELKARILDELEELKRLGQDLKNKKINLMEFKKVSSGMGIYPHRGEKIG